MHLFTDPVNHVRVNSQLPAKFHGNFHKVIFLACNARMTFPEIMALYSAAAEVTKTDMYPYRKGNK